MSAIRCCTAQEPEIDIRICASAYFAVFLPAAVATLLGLAGCAGGPPSASGDRAAPGAATLDAPATWGAPDAPLAATIGRDTIRTRSADDLRTLVLQRLTDRYAADQGIAVTDAERDAFIRSVDAFLRSRGAGPVGVDSPEDRDARRFSAGLHVRQWKVNRALHQRFGGRVIDQQGGPEPLDALRALVEAAQARGELAFHDRGLENGFWRYFRDEALHSFYPPDSAARVFDRPPWGASP